MSLNRFGFAKKHQILILDVTDENALVLYTPKTSLHALLEIQRFLNRPIETNEVNSHVFQENLSKAFESQYDTAKAMMGDIEQAVDLSELVEEVSESEELLEYDDAPIIRLLNALFQEAIQKNASDIHIENFKSRLNIRFRIDGILQEVLQPKKQLAPYLISRVKIMAKLDIAEKRLPQDGRIALTIAGRAVDVRVSTMPTAYGERLVLRLLDKQNANLDLKDLGMSQSHLEIIQRMIGHPHGIILVTGPTGSGKTTTLYAMLTTLNESSRNILTVEDPIEYDLQGIGQTQVNVKIGLTFASGLRAILRQDPDIVMVGEIRDLETAEIAVQASLTGHLVLSTLHTNHAVGAITRLIDMGVPHYLLSSSFVGVMAQRLVRVLCEVCKKPCMPTKDEEAILVEHGIEGAQWHQAVGCDACNHLGFKGRTGIYEVVEFDGKLKQMIHESASELKIKHHVKSHCASLYRDGLRVVAEGRTTMAEVIRVTMNG